MAFKFRQLPSITKIQFHITLNCICFVDVHCSCTCRKLRPRDVTKFHLQLSIALFCLLLVFMVGIERNENEIVCTAMSALIHYFTLAAVLWMGAEAVLMFQKLIIVFGSITVKFFVTVSLICWCKFLISNENLLHFSYAPPLAVLADLHPYVLGWPLRFTRLQLVGMNFYPSKAVLFSVRAE